MTSLPKTPPQKKLGLVIELDTMLGTSDGNFLRAELQSVDANYPLYYVLANTCRRLRYGLTKPAREILWTVLGREEKYKSKPFLDAAVYRGVMNLLPENGILLNGDFEVEKVFVGGELRYSK